MGKRLVDPSVNLFYPAPVALVTCSKDGEDPNIITIAWTGMLSSEPPTVGIAIRPGRYSHGLVSFSREFGVNFPKAEDIEKVDFCGVASGKKVNKFEKCGFTPFEGVRIRTPLIQECPVNLECIVIDAINLGSHTLFIGEMVAAHVETGLWKGETFQAMEANPLVYLPSTAQYVSLGNIIGRYSLSRGRL